ncbi:imelysin family protein [bacterium SCSIO 12741]|nr:imelysin family protein [bacterium SCSIO 12741]
MKKSSFLKMLILPVFAGMILGCNKDKSEPDPEPTPASFDQGILLTDMIDGVIIPSHESFLLEARNLNVAINDFINQPDNTTLELAQKQWISAAQIWRRCEPFNFGPIRSNYLHNKINTWPTNRDFIQGFIEGSDSLNSDFINSKGSSSKGLAAMEWLLFDPDSGNTVILAQLTQGTHSYRRRKYLQALGENMYEKAQQIQELWTGDYRQEFIDNQGTDLYSSLGSLTNQMISLNEKIIKSKMGKPLGKSSDNQAHPDLLESGLSGRSLAHIQYNLIILENIFLAKSDEKGNLTGYDDYLNFLNARHGDELLSAKILDQMEITENSLKNITPPLRTAIINQKAEVETAYEEFKSLLTLLKADMASSMGVTITFNDNDGD